MSRKWPVSKLALFVELETRPSRDLEDCLDLAVRKGKAGGEPKPTEKKDDVGPTSASRRLKNKTAMNEKELQELFLFITDVLWFSAAKVQRFFESRKKITQKLAYVQFLLYLRTPPCYAIPPKVQPRPAGHTQRMSGIFEKGCALSFSAK